MVNFPGPASGYSGSTIKYLSGTPADEQWGSANEELIRLYFLRFTSAAKILPMLADDFDHADGGGTCADGYLTLSPFFVGHGAHAFANEFRDETVAARAVQTGTVSGTYLRRSAARPLLDLVQAELRKHGESVHGELVGAAMVHFPGALRIGGEALDMPPFLMAPPVNAPAFTPVTADPDNPAMNQHTIRAVQLWLATAAEPDGSEDADTRLFTARVGIQLAGFADGYHLGFQPTVPGAIAEEVLNLRADQPLDYPPHVVTAHWLTDWAGRQSS